MIANIYENIPFELKKFLMADIFESIYAKCGWLFWLFGSFLVEIPCFLKAVLWTNWLTIVIHANSFAPLMDAICPRAFLIECVDAK